MTKRYGKHCFHVVFIFRIVLNECDKFIDDRNGDIVGLDCFVSKMG